MKALLKLHISNPVSISEKHKQLMNKLRLGSDVGLARRNLNGGSARRLQFPSIGGVPAGRGGF